MESFNWLNFILTILSSTTLTIIFVLITPLAKKLINKYIDIRFDKNKIKYEHDLGLITENARFDFQRKIYDFNIFSLKRHEIYAKLYKKILTIQGSVLSLMGFRESVDLMTIDKNNIKEFLKRNNFNESHINELIENWDSDRKTIVDKINNQLRNKEFNDAELELIKTNNYFLESKLFLSENIDDTSTKIISDVRSLFHIYKMSHYYQFYPEGKLEEETNLKKMIEENIKTLCNNLKVEISKGDYNE